MKLNKIILSALLMMTTSVTISGNRHIFVDSMVDFRYPVSMMEKVHTDLSQVMYKLEIGLNHKGGNIKDVLDDSIQTLEQVEDSLGSRHNIKPEDIDFLQGMIDRIDSLIAHLEEDDGGKVSTIRQMCCSIKEKMS